MSAQTASLRKPSAPVGYVVWFRPHVKGARWRKVFTTRSRTEATARIDGAGDWHLATIYDERLLPESVAGTQAGLFDPN